MGSLIDSQGKLRLAPSRINLYNRCPYAFYLKYIKEIRQPSASFFILGGAVHFAFEEYYRVKAEGKQSSLEEIKDVFSLGFEADWSEAEIDTGIEDIGEVEKGAIKDEGIKLIETYFPVAEEIIPSEVEKWVSAEIGSGIVLFGKFDLITKDGSIVDLKTSKRKKSKVDGASQIQLEIYKLATGQDGKCYIHNIIKKKKPEVEILEHPIPSPERIKSIAIAVASGIMSGSFPPAGVTTGVCDWCWYGKAGYCKYKA